SMRRRASASSTSARARRSCRSFRAAARSAAGARAPRTCRTSSGWRRRFAFEGVEGESLLLNLDQQGICASTGSACTSGSLEASHVLKAMGLPIALAQGSLRLSLGKSNDEDQIDRTLEALPGAVERLRSVLPVR